MAKEAYPGGFEQFIQSGETGAGAMQYCLAGEAVNGGVHYVEDGIVAIGEDTILYRPDLRLYGVFDGAGGASDIGRADLASRLSAEAVVGFFERYGTLEVDTTFMQEALQHARAAVSASQEAGVATGLFIYVAEPNEEAIKILYAAAGDCSAGVFPDPVFDGKKYDDVLWFAGDQEDFIGDPTNFIGKESGRIKRQAEDQCGEVEACLKRERFIFLCSDGITGSLGRHDGIDEADIEYAFTYKHDVVSIAQALINPPLHRELKRKVDDKSLVLLRV